ncbi:class I SAM-dependent methyltransferase [Streptomyces sp. NPDC037389]|uniref:class I SAM-dependent methyltransferase n=1 Tax=Streptomyces sp. NPDC037389 TaxID=3155369 RepID=UPI0033DA094A
MVLGAGLGTLAYRNPHAGLRVFEVDHPATQAWKRQRPAAAGIGIPRSVTFAPVDFEYDLLADVCDPSCPGGRGRAPAGGGAHHRRGSRRPGDADPAAGASGDEPGRMGCTRAVGSRGRAVGAYARSGRRHGAARPDNRSHHRLPAGGDHRVA